MRWGPTRPGGRRVAEGAQFGHFGQQVRGGVRRQTGDRGDDLGLAGERWLGGDELLDLGVNGAAMAVEHIQVGLMLLFEQGITEMIAPVEFGGAVPDEFVFSGLQVAQCPLALRRKRGGPKGQRGGHTRQHARIHRIGLGALSGGEAAPARD